jgi:hypothetical protein
MSLMFGASCSSLLATLTSSTLKLKLSWEFLSQIKTFIFSKKLRVASFQQNKARSFEKVKLFDELNSIISAENWRMQQKFPLFVPFSVSEGVNKPRILGFSLAARSLLIERLQRSALSRRASQIIGDSTIMFIFSPGSSPPPQEIIRAAQILLQPPFCSLPLREICVERIN